MQVYTDRGISGRRAKRPALDAMLAAARRRQIDAVAVVKLCRLGRSLSHLLRILGEFDDLGVTGVALDDGIDTKTAAGRLFMQIRGAFAGYEAEVIRERTRAGIAAAKRRGKRLGRPRTLRGQTYQLERLLREGQSLSACARELGCAVSTVHAERARLGIEPQ